MNFDYSNRSNNIRRVSTTIVLIVIAAISLIIYYSLSILYIPQLYFSSLYEVKSQPVFTGAQLSDSKAVLGESDFTITARNNGEQWRYCRYTSSFLVFSKYNFYRLYRKNIGL